MSPPDILMANSLSSLSEAFREMPSLSILSKLFTPLFFFLTFSSSLLSFYISILITWQVTFTSLELLSPPPPPRRSRLEDAWAQGYQFALFIGATPGTGGVYFSVLSKQLLSESWANLHVFEKQQRIYVQTRLEALHGYIWVCRPFPIFPRLSRGL